MEFQISNSTGKNQTYHHTGPQVTFEIIQGDSTIATSVDGLAWPQVVLAGAIENGNSEIYSWKAPNSLARDPAITLLPGTYTARAVMHYSFVEVGAEPISPITFTVIP